MTQTVEPTWNELMEYEYQAHLQNEQIAEAFWMEGEQRFLRRWAYEQGIKAALDENEPIILPAAYAEDYVDGFCDALDEAIEKARAAK